MKKRGKVLRDPHIGPGLLTVGGRQMPFVLEGVWKSEVPPKPGLAVDIDFNARDEIVAITVVPDSQLAREQAEAAIAAAQKQGVVMVSRMIARFGLPMLIAAGALLVGWFVLSAATVQTSLGRVDFTFWQLLGLLNSNGAFEGMFEGARGASSAGLYGFLAVLAWAGPFLSYFWKDKRAALGGLLPLVFMVLVALMVRGSIHNSLSMQAGGALDAMVQQMREEAMHALSPGSGAYVSGLASLYFAGVGIRGFFTAKGREKADFEQLPSAAA